jgi:hypothetical protein
MNKIILNKHNSYNRIKDIQKILQILIHRIIQNLKVKIIHNKIIKNLNKD